MKIKTILTIVLAFSIVTIFCVPSFNVTADQTATAIIVSSVQGEKETNVNISVGIDANSGVAAGTFILNYDTKSLETVSAAEGAVLAGSGLSDISTDTVNGKITLAYINMDGFNGFGSILDVTFKIKSTASGIIPLTLDVAEFADSNYDNIAYSVTQGIITVDSTPTATPVPTSIPTVTATATSTNSPVPAPVIDLASVEWARDQIQSLSNRGLINGKGYTSDGIIFAPLDQITRVELTKLIVKAFNIPGSGADANFMDVSVETWYYNVVGAAFKSGIIAGTSSETFEPETPITRQDMCTIMVRAMVKYQQKNLIDEELVSVKLNIFNDATDIFDYAKVFVATAVNLEMIYGTTDEGALKFKPLDNTNRAEAAVVIYRMLYV